MAEAELLEPNLLAALETFRHKNKKRGQSEALKVAVDFLVASGIEQKLVIPLIQLLMDLAQEGPRQKPTDVAMLQAHTAAFIDALKMTGLSVKEAADAIEKETDGYTQARHLMEYRKNLKKRKAQPEAIEVYFQSKRDICGAIAGADSKEVQRKAILATVREILIMPKKG